MRFFTEPFALLWRHRHLLRQTVRIDIRTRYAGAVLGLVWLVLYPLLFLTVYASVYIFIYRVEPARGDEALGTLGSVALIFCGLIPFLGFSEALGTGVTAVTANASLIRNTLFPIDLIPVKTVLASQCVQATSTVILLLAVFGLGRGTPWILLLPVIWMLQVMFTMGVIWILSSLNVYLRDLQSLISVIILMLMVLSPIAYSVERVRTLSPVMQTVLRLNPLYYLILSYKECLMRGRFPQGELFPVLVVMSFTMFLCGYWFFSRMKRIMIDNV